MRGNFYEFSYFSTKRYELPHKILVLIASLSKEGSDESAHSCSLIKAFVSRILKYEKESGK